MAEGDTILLTARLLETALGGQQLEVEARDDRARAAGVERLDGLILQRVQTRGKHLLLRFGEGEILHSHLGMSGSWHVLRPGERWRKPARAAWVVLRGEGREVVQFGGPTLRVLDERTLRGDPVLSQLGPDVLAPDFDPATAARSLRRDTHRELGEALLDQRLLAGVGNIFKSEACFAAGVSPWRRVAELSDEELRATLAAANRLMSQSVASSRPQPRIYRQAGRPCPACATPIASRGQGDANRTTYWCSRCQSGKSPPRLFI